MKLLIAQLLLLLSCGWMLPAHAQQTAVYVKATAEDNIGSRLVFAVRERIRESHGLNLVDAESDSFIQLRLVTMDGFENGSSTVYSAVITAKQLNNPSAKIFWTHFVGTCGSSRIQACADSIAANVDDEATEFREILSDYMKKNNDLGK